MIPPIMAGVKPLGIGARPMRDTPQGRKHFNRLGSLVAPNHTRRLDRHLLLLLFYLL
jgi:hypothetical protein